MLSLIDKFKAFKDKIQKIDEEIEALDQSLDKKAEHIRLFWTKPIVYLNAEIDYAYHKKDNCFSKKSEKQDEIRSVCSELHQMASQHSDDQSRWDRLQRERSELSDDIDNLKEKIEELKSKINSKRTLRKCWHDKRDHICFILVQNKVNFITSKRIAASDEQRIITTRLAEIEQIRIKGVAEAEEVCEREKQKLVTEYTSQRDAYLKRSDELNGKLKETTTKIKAQ